MKYLTEEILWNHVRDGEGNAFKELFNLYADSLLAYGLKFTCDRDEVKDVIQDLFVRIIRGHSSLPEVANVRAYMLQAFRNNLVNRISREREYSFDGDDVLRRKVEAVSLIETVEYDPDDGMLLRRKRVGQAIATLTAQQKEAIYLRFVQNLSAAEIAEILGIKVQSVRNQVHRGIIALRKQLGEK